MWGATYDEDDGWHFDRRWPGLARRWLEAWTTTSNGDPAPITHRSWGEYAGDYVELETWPTPADVGLGVNVDWEGHQPWSRDPHTRITAALHIGLLTVTLTWWRRRPRVTVVTKARLRDVQLTEDGVGLGFIVEESHEDPRA